MVQLRREELNYEKWDWNKMFWDSERDWFHVGK
jgi:hypothetical protein